MAKRFGRNQKRQLQEQQARLAQQIDQQNAENNAKLEELQQQSAEWERQFRSQRWANDARKRNQVLIELSLERQPINQELGVRLSAIAGDYNKERVISYSRIDPPYVMSRDEEASFVCAVGEMVARQLFEEMRNKWNIGYGVQENPYERGYRPKW